MSAVMLSLGGDAESVAHQGGAVTPAYMTTPTTPRRQQKLEPMSIRLDPDVKDALAVVSIDQERSLSWVANRVLRQWLKSSASEIEAARRRIQQSK